MMVLRVINLYLPPFFIINSFLMVRFSSNKDQNVQSFTFEVLILGIRTVIRSKAYFQSELWKEESCF